MTEDLPRELIPEPVLKEEPRQPTKVRLLVHGWPEQVVNATQGRRILRAWREGYVAAAAGANMFTGPYRESNYERPLRDAWRAGYNAHQKEKAAAPGATAHRVHTLQAALLRQES